MKKFINYLKEYIKEQWNWKLYLVTGIFLTITITLNYTFDYKDDFVNSFFRKQPWTHLFFQFLTFGTAYFGTCFFIHLFTDNKNFLKKPSFWLVSIFGLLVISHYCTFHHHFTIAKSLPTPLYRYGYKFFSNLKGLFICILPLWIFYKLYDKKEVGHFYGFRTEGVNFKPYWIMLACMIPLLISASFLEDFHKTYPFYQRARGDMAANYLDIPEYILAIIFELSYASRFLTVELFFRGFLIMAMVRFLDKDVVLPMAVTYAFLHFGKPMPETVSSFFGGYILGVVALYSRNIWGGVFVHVGIALLMDLFVYLQK